ncbi:MAG: RNA-binding protein [Acidobacteriota bacterium]|nr:RNA-binding protein [Acidobacteriota bacterium]
MNIYVGNLPFKTSDDDLRDLFQQYGEVTSARVIIDRDTGRSRGFGFVEMADDGSASEAIQNLDNSDFDGRNLKVNEARPRNNGGGGGRRGGGGGGYRDDRW